MKKHYFPPNAYKRSNFLQIGLSLLIVLFISCNKGDDFLSLPSINSSFNAKEAEEWYNSQTTSSLRLSSSNQTRITLFTSLQPDWSKAIFKRSKVNEDFLIVPFKKTLNFKDSKKPEQSIQLQLRIFKDAMNEFQGRIVEIEADNIDEQLSNYTLSDSFSGKFFFRSIIDGKILFGYRYENGRVTYKITPKTANARLAGEICTCTVRYYYTCYCQKFGTTWGEADVIVDGTSAVAGCGEVEPSTNELITPTAVQMGYRCGGWENNGSDTYSECHYVEDPITGDPGTGGSGGNSFNTSGFSPGQKPVSEFTPQNKCSGLQAMWNAGVQNNNSETYGVITSDSSLLFTEIGGQFGGTFNGLYENGGTTYYFYPKAGNPVPSYPGTVTNHSTYYFIPIISTVHTHTPCLSDNTDGITNRDGSEDFPFAARFSQIKHYVIGCGKTGQFNNYAYINVTNGTIAQTCNSIK